MAAVLEFRILGPLEIQADGKPLAIAASKQRALLAFLLMNANEVVSRERLIDSLWPDNPPATAANALQVHISQLRKSFANTGADATALDVTRFAWLLREAATARERAAYGDAAALLDEALGLWRGPALADLASEQFAQPEIGRLEESRLGAVEDRLACEIELGHAAQAVGELEVLVAHHPLRERLRALLMLALYRSGRQADALEAYRAARSMLRDELGIEPGTELRALEQAILRQDASIGESRPPDLARTPVPSFLAPFVGRERELEEVLALLQQRDVRLVTLTGLGGIGKTRLAVAAAQRLEGGLADGAAYVGLATIRDPELVAAKIAQALLPGEIGSSPAEVLVEYLRERRLLLVLDNFEQVLNAAPLLSALLSAAPGLKLLITSRARLQLSGEREYPVSTLPTGRIVRIEYPDDGFDSWVTANVRDAHGKLISNRTYFSHYGMVKGNAAALARDARVFAEVAGIDARRTFRWAFGKAVEDAMWSLSIDDAANAKVYLGYAELVRDLSQS